MKPGIDPLIILYVDLDGVRLQLAPVLALVSIAPDHVVRLARRHPLGEFAEMIGHKFPMSMFSALAADLHPHTVKGAGVRSPGGTEDQGVGLKVLGLGGRTRETADREDGCRQKAQEAKGRKPPAVRSSHRLRLPLLPRPPRSLPLPPSSVRGG